MLGDPSPAPGGPEIVIAHAPFTVRRTTRWHECDPAGVVYAGNFTQYLLSAVDLFKQHLLADRRGRPEDRLEYQTPAKATSLVYLSPLWPDDVFDVVLYAGDVRTHTSDVFAFASRADNAAPVFAGRLSSIYVSSQDRRRAVPVPHDVRAIFEAYRVRHPLPERLIAEVGR